MKKLSQAKVKRLLRSCESLIEYLSAGESVDHDFISGLEALLDSLRSTYILLLQEEQSRLSGTIDKRPVGRPKKSDSIEARLKEVQIVDETAGAAEGAGAAESQE